eukprot:CAMPEP_0115155588 /NCGR_PEP_ID=MMETSP0227-20121206/67980_1 /TAXON_ID=89957 /ORGANISM="Polarella glacialis, Strain CCMP 1383" /LENGTH=36 /DNA_ID= /DNA_START= /DNA_END= /DNA_ORIENTATION=
MERQTRDMTLDDCTGGPCSVARGMTSPLRGGMASRR